MRSSLQFKEFHVVETIYRYNPFLSVDDDTLNPSFDFELEYNNDSKTEAWITLITEMGDINLKKNSTYVRAAVLGQFEIEADEQMSTDEKIGLYRVNGVAILYPYLRSLVSDLTGKGSEQSIILPTLNIVEVMKSYESNND